MTSPRRHALLVGIDRYKNLAGHGQLRSCANDARLMASVLADAFGFQRDDVSLLLDEEATRERILAGMRALRLRAQPGDAVVFYYSGHGSRAADCHGDEPDGWDETLVPHDSGRDPFPNLDIRDHEIYEWLLEMSEVTRNIAVVADTCYAGGATRGGEEWTGAEAREKWIAWDPRPQTPPLQPSSRVAARRTTRSVFRDAGPSGLLPLDERYVLLAACRADEHAKEMKSQPQSVFTFFLCQELVRASAAATYRELIERVRFAVATEARGQTPQVEGARDRVLFGEGAAPPELFLPVLERQGVTVRLGGGAVHGVDRGSVWAVRPAGTRRAGEGNLCGLVRIEKVAAVESRGRILEEPGSIVEGARAFEKAWGPDRLRLPVALPREGAEGSREPVVRALALAIDASRLLRTAEDGEAAGLRIALAMPAGKRRDEATIEVEEPSWVVLGAEDELLLPPLPRDRPDAVARLLRSLEDQGRWRNLLGIAPGEDERLDVEIEIELLRSRGTGGYETAQGDEGGEVVFHEEDLLGLRITHQAEQPLYLHVLDIGLLGAVSPIYPVSGANKPLVPGLAFEIGTRAGQGLVVQIPEGLAVRARAAREPRIEGRESLKLFLTSREADLSGWQQATHHAMRGAMPEPATTRGAGGGLAALVGQALGAAPTRSVLTEPAAGDRWTTRSVSFLVRRMPSP
jgi:hypothetical protein